MFAVLASKPASLLTHTRYGVAKGYTVDEAWPMLGNRKSLRYYISRQGNLTQLFYYCVHIGSGLGD